VEKTSTTSYYDKDDLPIVGEGDLSYEYWKKSHYNFSNESIIVFEIFKLIKKL